MIRVLIPLWCVVFSIAFRMWLDDHRWLRARKRARQPGLNTLVDADQFVAQLHEVSDSEPRTAELTAFEHDERDLWMPIARTTPLVAHLAAETARIQTITMTRTEIVWDMGTPIYDAVVADMRNRREQAERRRRALTHPTAEFRQIVAASLYADSLIGRPPVLAGAS